MIFATKNNVELILDFSASEPFFRMFDFSNKFFESQEKNIKNHKNQKKKMEMETNE